MPFKPLRTFPKRLWLLLARVTSHDVTYQLQGEDTGECFAERVKGSKLLNCWVKCNPQLGVQEDEHCQHLRVYSCVHVRVQRQDG